MKTYLLAATHLSCSEINEIEGYLAQQGIEVAVINRKGFSDPITFVAEGWSDNTFSFRLRMIGDKSLTDDVLEIIEQRLQSDSRVVREGMKYRVLFDQKYSGDVAAAIVRGITATVMHTLNFLGHYEFEG